MGLGPGESIEHTKHRVSLEGHPWPGCRPEVTPGVDIVLDRPSKEGGLNNVGQLEQKGFCPARWGHPGCKTLQIWKGKVQPATSQMSEMDTPLDHAKEEAMPLMEWALTPIGHYNPEEEYANVIASTKHLEISCFATGPPLARLLKPKKSSFDFLSEAERSMYILRALTGQSRDSWLPVGGNIWKAL